MFKIGKPKKMLCNTLLAAECRFVGDMNLNAPIDIYGELNGNIHAENNEITIMAGGKVVGNIVCAKLRVDGELIGECTSDSIEIGSNGHVDGCITYKHLSIIYGGRLSGTSKYLQPAESSVIELVSEPSPSSQKKPDLLGKRKTEQRA